MDNITDSELIDLIESGNQDAFMQLLIKYQSAIHGYAYHLSQNDSAAQDITQETFIAAYSNLHTLRNARSLESWLRSITYHKSMDWIHKNGPYGPLPDNLQENQQGKSNRKKASEVSVLQYRYADGTFQYKDW